MRESDPPTMLALVLIYMAIVVVAAIIAALAIWL